MAFRSRGTLWTGLLVAAAGATVTLTYGLSATRSDQLEDLPAGLWRVAEASPTRGLLTQQPDFSPGAGLSDRPRTLVVQNGRVLNPRLAITVTTLDLDGLPRSTSTQVPLFSAALNGRQRVVFTSAGDGPQLQRRPGDAINYTFSALNTVWIYSPERGEREYAADQAGGLSRAALAARADSATEEGHHLIWAADPLWSGDGTRLVFTTNREAVAAEGMPAGQSVWIKNVQTNVEEPLLQAPDVAFTTFGWLGDELVYTRNDQPGIHGIDQRTRQTRLLARGEPLAVAPRGVAFAFRDDEGVVRLRSGNPEYAPPPPGGMTYSSFAAFAPSGGLVALLASSPEGDRTLVIVDLAKRDRRLYPLHSLPAERGLVDLLDPPAWIDDGHMLINTIVRSAGQAKSQMLRVI